MTHGRYISTFVRYIEDTSHKFGDTSDILKILRRYLNRYLQKMYLLCIFGVSFGYLLGIFGVSGATPVRDTTVFVGRSHYAPEPNHYALCHEAAAKFQRTTTIDYLVTTWCQWHFLTTPTFSPPLTDEEDGRFCVAMKPRYSASCRQLQTVHLAPKAGGLQ